MRAESFQTRNSQSPVLVWREDDQRKVTVLHLRPWWEVSDVVYYRGLYDW